MKIIKANLMKLISALDPVVFRLQIDLQGVDDVFFIVADENAVFFHIRLLFAVLTHDCRGRVFKNQERYS